MDSDNLVEQKGDDSHMGTIICLCKHITEESIQKAIKNGADTVHKVRIATGATSGVCKGGRCTNKIQEMIDAEKNS